MSTPTATPHTDDTPYQATPSADLRQQIMDSRVPKNEREWWAQRTIEKLETELAAAKVEAAHYMSIAQKATDELVRLRAQNDQFSDNLSAVGKAYNAEKDRAERAEAELAARDAEYMRGGKMLAESAAGWQARAERAEAALAKWSVLNLWGGTPEIIHEFIKGQQNRIHHCQDLEAECLEQARLLGMSGEREADLLGKLERLRAEVERLKELLRIESASAQHALATAERAEAELSDERARLDWLLDRSAQTHHSYSNPLGGGNYVQYHKDRAAIDAAMKP